MGSSAYPLQLDWHQSGYFVLSMILGGAGTVWGSLVGAFIYVIGKDVISTITPAWQIYLGAFFVACVLGFGMTGRSSTITAAQNTDFHTPRAAAIAASRVSSAVCAEAS